MDNPADKKLPSARAAIEVSTEPGEAIAEHGLVLLDGPQGVAVTMTPQAARLTADRLLVAAEEADRHSGQP